VPTVDESKVPADGALLVLTTAVTADPTGAIYENRIEPDQRIAEVHRAHADEAPDLTLQAAAAWLRAQPGCLTPV
jgi:hypothetical protein